MGTPLYPLFLRFSNHNLPLEEVLTNEAVHLTKLFLNIAPQKLRAKIKPVGPGNISIFRLHLIKERLIFQ